MHVLSSFLLSVAPHWTLREPFSALSHLLGAVLAIVGLFLLLRRARRHGSRGWDLVELLAYGVSVVLMFAASGLFHALGSEGEVTALKKLDHAAIFLIIAGTGTAIYNGLGAQRATLYTALLWSISLVGLSLKMLIWPMPLWLSALIYVGVGWIGTVGLIGVVRAVGWRPLRGFLAGAFVLTLGAVVFATQLPILWPGVIEGHEVFHVLVLLGVGLHYRFVYTYCTCPRAFCGVVTFPRPATLSDALAPEWQPA